MNKSEQTKALCEIDNRCTHLRAVFTDERFEKIVLAQTIIQELYHAVMDEKT